MTHLTRTIAATLALASLAACKDKETVARADSLQGALNEQQQLSNQLNAQKDSLTRVVLDADAFLGQMDSAISTVRGLPRTKRAASDPLADQVAARKEMMTRVSALVSRAKETARQLAELQRKQADTEQQNVTLQAQAEAQIKKIEGDAQLITDLGTTIERQRTQIVALEARLDSLGTQVQQLGTRHFRAYYVIGTEQELMEKGVIVKEGGANLLIARPGRTLQPARVLDPAAFVAVDQREVKEIQVPDSTRRYKLVSRQSLDAAEVGNRKGTEFTGNLRITNPDEFWAASRFLILVRM